MADLHFRRDHRLPTSGQHDGGAGDYRDYPAAITARCAGNAVKMRCAFLVAAAASIAMRPPHPAPPK